MAIAKINQDKDGHQDQMSPDADRLDHGFRMITSPQPLTISRLRQEVKVTICKFPVSTSNR
jgi:hypothetical protein